MSGAQDPQAQRCCSPPCRPNDPPRAGAEKLLGQLAEQKEMVTATLEGRMYQPPKTLGMRKDAQGQRVRMEVNRRVRRGWFQDEAAPRTSSSGLAASPCRFSRARRHRQSAPSTSCRRSSTP